MAKARCADAISVVGIAGGTPGPPALPPTPLPPPAPPEPPAPPPPPEPPAPGLPPIPQSVGLTAVDVVGVSATAMLPGVHPAKAGFRQAMSMALEDAGIGPNQVDYVNLHGTSTVLNDKIETTAVKIALGDHAYQTPFLQHGHKKGSTCSIQFDRRNGQRIAFPVSAVFPSVQDVYRPLFGDHSASRTIGRCRCERVLSRPFGELWAYPASRGPAKMFPVV